MKFMNLKWQNELKDKLMKEGYTENWGDGGINEDNLCILQKCTNVPYLDNEGQPKGDKVRTRRDFAVINDYRVVYFYDVSSYSS